MTLPPEIVAKLNLPLSPSRVHKREGSGGKALDYIATHDAIRIANAVFGYGQWGHEIVELVQIGCDPVTSKSGKPGYKVGYRCTVRLTVVGCVPTSGVGYGDGVDYSGSMIPPHELAAKEAESDALKRALKNFGDQFGLVLYAKPGEERQRVEREAAIRRERHYATFAGSAGSPERPAAAATTATGSPAGPVSPLPADESPVGEGLHTPASGDGPRHSSPAPTGTTFVPPAAVPALKPPSAKMLTLMNILVDRVARQSARVTLPELWAWCGHTPDDPEDAEHFSPLRGKLTMHEASELIDHLTTLEEFAIADGALEPRKVAA